MSAVGLAAADDGDGDDGSSDVDEAGEGVGM